jgi:FlaA1/EpsC-like NDP-sugar epimerase
MTRREGRAYQPVGFVDDDRAKLGLRVHGIEVLGNRSDLAGLVERERVELIILAMNNVSGEKLRSIVSLAQQTPAQIKIARGSFDWAAAAKGVPLVREVRVEDLLGRPQASLDYSACERTLGYKTVLVTGACGSIGSELCRKIASFSPRRLVAIDNNETGIYDLEIELRLKFPAVDLKVVVADVTNAPRMEALFRVARPDVIFHVAAYKHVPLMEAYPEEAVRVNCLGTAIVLRNARRYRAERFVLVSTDKAVNPSSVMGATKRVAEMLVMSAAAEARGTGQPGDGGLLCTTVRFGNVLASRGSVVPTFARQIELGGPVTVTHVEMTRYFMDISEAASLIIQAATLTQGQDIFMLDMGERIRIDDLARKMIRMRGLRPEIDIPIEYTGMRAGEKLHEELAYADEEKEATAHPLIHRLKGERKLEAGVVQQVLDRLLELAGTGAREQLVRELLEFSRSKQPSESALVESDHAARGALGAS